jgi:phthiodiolone/phenolphthiodiolone dimycocerosates ketoreductase
VARLAEGIDVIRLLWQAGEPVDFEGRFFSLRRAVLGLSPFGAGPPVWTAAHGPRMLELTGRKADGWLPTKMTPGQYQASLKAIEVAAREAGRDPEAITPAMLGYVLLGPDEALRIVAGIPPAVVRHYAFCGTPEQVAAKVREYAAAGLRHLVMWNITAFGDPGLARYSFAALKELRAELSR